MTAMGKLIDDFCSQLESMSLDDRVDAINDAREKIHEHSPFKSEPVDCIRWVKANDVNANDYNPNSVAPPEMELLRLSIANDGYTQPIVTWDDDGRREVIDGFHRNRVGKECKEIQARIHGHLPVVTVNSEMTDKKNRIASTIRHNRARGKHKVDSMSDIVMELKNRNWANKRICKELGMDEDEVLRLCQITGLEDMFKDGDFSKAWESSDAEGWLEPLDDDFHSDEEYRTVNTSDPDRVFHTYDKWECQKAGFYATAVDGKNKTECETEYAEFLNNSDEFRAAAMKVMDEWKNSCEHYLTNKSMNRIAWVGQAAACYGRGLPSKYCAGFNRLSDEEQETANNVALDCINYWMSNNDRELVEMNDAISAGRQISIY